MNDIKKGIKYGIGIAIAFVVIYCACVSVVIFAGLVGA